MAIGGPAKSGQNTAFKAQNRAKLSRLAFLDMTIEIEILQLPYLIPQCGFNRL